MRSSSPVRLYLTAGIVALFAAGCGSAANPVSPMAAAGSNTSQKGGSSAAGKVDVCHWDGVVFNMINVSSNALPSHLAHGDGQPNGAVPNANLQVFGASCQVLNLKKYTVTLVSGAGGSAFNLDPAVSFARTSGGTGTAVILKTHPAYASLPGAKWVNYAIINNIFSGNHGYGLQHLGDDITYSIGFTLPAGAVNASLSGSFYADNRGAGFLNGAPIGAHASPFEFGFNTAAAVSASTGFVAGANTLSFKVEDQGGVAGLTFAVTITYYAL